MLDDGNVSLVVSYKFIFSNHCYKVNPVFILLSVLDWRTTHTHTINMWVFVTAQQSKIDYLPLHLMAYLTALHAIFIYETFLLLFCLLTKRTSSLWNPEIQCLIHKGSSVIPILS